MPRYLVDFLGPKPDSLRGVRRWKQLAADVTEHRQRYGITDPDRALGPEPRTADLERRRAWRKLRLDAERLWQPGSMSAAHRLGGVWAIAVTTSARSQL
jgi:hypothetical protein